jgi:integrase
MPTIRQRGANWHVQIRRAGHPPHTRSFKHRADAAAWARKVEAGIDRGEAPLNARLLKGQTLATLLTRYQATISPKKRGHLQERYRLNQLLRHRIAAVSLSKLSAGIIANFRDERLRAVQGVTVRRELALLRHVFEVARREWDTGLNNPVAQIKLPEIPDARSRRVIDDELERLLAECRRRGNSTMVAVIVLAVETAMRRGELVSVTWANVNLQARTLVIHQTKNGHARTIPLTPLALETIESLPRREDRIIPLSANALRLTWERSKRKAGVGDLHFHDLRHEAISRFFEKGLSIPEVALISGHRDVRQLFRYTHLRAEDDAKKLG